MKIGICDDEEFYLDALEKNIKEYADSHSVEVIIQRYHSGKELAEDIAENSLDFQMIFLDVEMPGWNGVKTAEKIREFSDDIVICFVTSHEGYSLNAFQVGAIGYIVKPIVYEAFEKVMDKAEILIAYSMNQTEAQKRYIQIKVNKKIQTVDTNQILYIEKHRNRSIVHLEKEELVCYEPLKDIYERLDTTTFVYTNQGSIVKFGAIREVRKDRVCLGKGIEVPLSRSYQKQVLNKYHDKIERLKAEKQKERE